MSSSLRHTYLRCMAFFVIVGTVSACGHEPVRRVATVQSVPHSQSPPRSTAIRTTGEKAATMALRQIGVPYEYGGSTEDGFDCSGLVQYAYASAGKRIPRTAAEQWRQLGPVGRDEIRVGDLLFFRIDGKISHVGMYVGKGRFVHAPSSGRDVSTESLSSDFYRKAFVRAGRPR